MRVRTVVVIALLAFVGTPARAGSDDLPPVQAVAVGDFDGDGKPDIAVGLPEVNAGKLKKAGEVRIYSGADGKFLRKLPGDSADQSYGNSLAAIGDADGDGATDLAIAAPFGDPGPYVDIVSGKTGKRITTRKAAGAIQWGNAICALGDGAGKSRVDLLVRWIQQNQWRVYYTDKEATAGSVDDDAAYMSNAVVVGDVDGDGTADVAICAWSKDDRGMKSAGLVRVISGDLLRRGRVDKAILTLRGDHAYANLGLALAPAGDWDGDGKADLVVGVADADDKKGIGSARVFSGKDGAELWKATAAGGDWHAPQVALVGDADGDGKPDVAVSSPAAASGAGVVSVVAAKDGATIWTLKGAAKENFGDEIRPFADLDGDGVADLLVVSPGAAVKGTKGNGYVRILSGKTGATLLLVNPLVAK